jgi:hypothetical protein
MLKLAMSPIIRLVKRSLTTGLGSRPKDLLNGFISSVFPCFSTVLSLLGAKASKSNSSTSMTNWQSANRCSTQHAYARLMHEAAVGGVVLVGH